MDVDMMLLNMRKMKVLMCTITTATTTTSLPR